MMSFGHLWSLFNARNVHLMCLVLVVTTLNMVTGKIQNKIEFIQNLKNTKISCIGHSRAENTHVNQGNIVNLYNLWNIYCNFYDGYLVLVLDLSFSSEFFSHVYKLNRFLLFLSNILDFFCIFLRTLVFFSGAPMFSFDFFLRSRIFSRTFR